MYASQIPAELIGDVILNRGNITDFDSELAQIYGLHDPDTSELRYVGVTCDPDGRLAQHLTPSNLHKMRPLSAWLRALVAAGKRPVMRTIETVSIDKINAVERRAIADARTRGEALLNVRPGGERSTAMRGVSKRGASSQYAGVSWHSRDNRWQVRFCAGGKDRHVGYFGTEEEAAHAYDAEARRFMGPSARTNFPLRQTDETRETDATGAKREKRRD